MSVVSQIFRPLSVVGESQLTFLSLVGNFFPLLAGVSNIFCPLSLVAHPYSDPHGSVMSFVNHVLLAILLDSVHITPEEIENAIMAGHFEFVIEEN